MSGLKYIILSDYGAHASISLRGISRLTQKRNNVPLFSFASFSHISSEHIKIKGGKQYVDNYLSRKWKRQMGQTGF